MKLRILLTAALCSALSAFGGCATSLAPESRPTEPLADLVWLAGSWLHVGEDGMLIEEHWTGPAGGTMLGVGRTLKPAADDSDAAFETASHECLRIAAEPDGSIVYHAAPMGRHPPTPFSLERGPASELDWRLVFTNPRHDFPQRIAYELQGHRDRLRVTISAGAEAADGANAADHESISWFFRRMEHPSDQLWRRLDHQRHMMDRDAFIHGAYKTPR